MRIKEKLNRWDGQQTIFLRATGGSRQQQIGRHLLLKHSSEIFRTKQTEPKQNKVKTSKWAYMGYVLGQITKNVY